MNNMMKLTIAMLICIAALIGPTVATTIEISTCPEDGFGMIPLAPGEVIQEGIYSNGPEFYISSDGMVQYLGDPVEAPSYTSINYGMEVGAPYLRLVWITLLPCAPLCPAFVEENSDTSELDGSYVYFTTLPNSRFVDGDGNGDWRSKPYLWTCDGTEWTSVIYSSRMGLPEGAVLEVRKTNLDAPEVLSAYAYL